MLPTSLTGGGISPQPGGNDARRPTDSTRINHEIRSPEVRLIGADSGQLGVVKIRDALRMAEEAGLDLVEIAATAKPPVCKIVDYGKFRYEISKKEKDQRKKQHNVQVKRIQISPNIDDNDFNVKATAARKFLEQGHRVKVIMIMRGRLVTRKEMAEDVVKKFVASLEDIARSESEAKMEGFNSLSVVLYKKK